MTGDSQPGLAPRAAQRTKLARRPDLDTLYCINPDGSRRMIHPADVRGRYQRRKKILWAILVVIYLVVPWIEIGGQPAILIDIASRHFYLFGRTFNAQDFYLAFFWVSGIGFALILLSALFGRVWCGYGCPQTVFLEGVFRRIERWIEGSAQQRQRLAMAPWGPKKILKKTSKLALYLVVSLVLSHTFLSYFMPVEQVLAAVTEPPSRHPVAFAFVMAFTAIIYFNFAWFREQLCIVLCPYGRLQSALTDPDTINVIYDQRRGEPRGRYHERNRGDCIDCFRCVAVCPTGIDIRNGTPQLECVGCANCIDACDEVMAKVGQKPGLIRYDSQRGVETGQRRFLRARLWVYAGLLLAGTVAFAIAAGGRTPFEAVPLRFPGPPYVIERTDEGQVVRNQLYVHVVNKQPTALEFRIAPAPGQPFRFQIPTDRVSLQPLADAKLPVFVRLPLSEVRPALTIDLMVRAEARVMHARLPFLGPGGR